MLGLATNTMHKVAETMMREYPYRSCTLLMPLPPE